MKINAHRGRAAARPQASAWVRCVMLVCGMAVWSTCSLGATYYWDTDGPTPGFGTASGTWSASNFWSTSDTGVDPTAGPTITTTDSVFFGTDAVGLASGSVAVSAAGQGFETMTFGAASGAINLTSGSLTLAASSTVAMNAVSGTISSRLIGLGSGLTKIGAGSLILTGSNTFTGRTIVTGGTLGLAFEVNLGSNPASFLANALTVDGAGILTRGTCTLDDSNRGMYLGVGNATVDTPANTRFTASIPITGPGGIVKNGIRELVLGGTNSFSGGITVNEGKLVFATTASDNNVPALVMTGGTVSLGIGFDSGTATIGSLSGGVGSVIDTAYSASNATRTLSVAQTTSGTFAGTMLNAGTRLLAFVKTGSATLTLEGANAYTGETRIDAGTLSITQSAAISTSRQLTIAANATLDATGITGGYVLPVGQPLAGSGGVVGGLTVGGGATIVPAVGSGALTVTGGLTLTPDGKYNWQMLDATGTAGGGWGLISTDSLTLSGLSAASPFNVNLWSLSSSSPSTNGDAANFNASVAGSWRILTSASTIGGFDPTSFSLTTSATAGTGGFTNAVLGGSFSLALSSDALGIDLLFTPSVVVPLTWYGNGTTAGGSGTWSSAGLTWNDGSTTVAWNPAEGAAFGTVGGTVTVNGNQSVGSGISFLADGYVLAGGTVALAGSQSVNAVSVSSGATATIAGTLVAANGLTKAAGGTLRITGSLAAPGGLVLTGGTLAFDRAGSTTLSDSISGGGALEIRQGVFTMDGANASFTGATTLAGGTLVLGSATALGASSPISFTGGVLQYTSANATDYSPGISTAGGQAVVIDTNGQSVTFATGLSGVGTSLTKRGEGTLTLAGTSTITGRTIVAGGTLGLASEANLGANPSAFLADALTVDGAALLATGTCTLDDANRGITVTAGGATIDTPAGTRFTASVPITGAGGIVKNGSRELVFGSTNSFTGGITVNDGKLVFSSAASDNNVPAVVMTGGTVSLSVGFDSGTATIGNLSGAAGSVIDTAYSGANAIRTLSVSQSVSGTFAGELRDATSNRVLALVKTGSATLTLAGLNQYTGRTSVNAGTLTFAAPSSLYYGTEALWTADRIVVASDATAAVMVGGAGFQGYQVAALAGLGTGTTGFLDGSSLGLDTSASGGAFTLTDVIANPNGGATPLGVAKLGEGVLEITSANTYTGVTSVRAGTLSLLPGGSIDGSTKVAIDAGAVFDVTTLAGYVVPAVQTLAGTGTVAGAVTIGGGATLSPGASPGTLTFAGDVAWNSAGNYNWQMLSGTGTSGDAWDLVAVSGGLTIGATSADPFNVNLWSLSAISPDVSGSAANFTSTTSGTWRIATAAGGISGFAADKFRVTTSATNGTGGFANGLAGGTFSIAQSGNSLNLVFTKGTAPTVITINVASGTQTQTQAGYPTLTGTVPVLKTGTGTLVVDQANTLTGSMTVQAGRLQLANGSALAASRLVVVAGGTGQVAPVTTTSIASLDLASGNGLLDLTSGALTIAGGMTADQLVAEILEGRGDGSWTGTSGITSSEAATAVASSIPRAVGWVDNGDGSLTVAYAAPGDTNIDWSIDILDASNFLALGKFDTGLPATWIEGDFSYDGIVDILDAADFFATALYDVGNYNTVAGARPAPYGVGLGPSAVAAVPEPTTMPFLAACGILAVAGLRRRPDRTTAMWRKVVRLAPASGDVLPS